MFVSCRELIGYNMDFQGFSPDTIDFLWGIRFNNNREWFEQHKKQYQKSLYEPMKMLAKELCSCMQDFPELECKVSRIYRDARMHPPTPYKESLWICFRTSDIMWGEQPVLFFEITPDDYSFGFLFWFPKTAQMEKFRKILISDAKPFVSIIDNLERTTDIRLSSESFKKPKPCPNPELERFFKMKNFGAFVTRNIDEKLFSPEIVKEVCDTFDVLKPLLRYCRMNLI